MKEDLRGRFVSRRRNVLLLSSVGTSSSSDSDSCSISLVSSNRLFFISNVPYAPLRGEGGRGERREEEGGERKEGGRGGG